MTIRQHLESYINFREKETPILEYIVDFVTTNSDVMGSDGYTKRLVFGEQRKMQMLSIYGFNMSIFNDFKRTNAVLRKNFATVSDPLNLCLLTSYANSNSPKRRVFLDFLALKLYTSKIYRSFPNGVREERMNYVLNHVLTRKSFVVKYKTLGAVIQKVVDTYLRHFGPKLDRLTDEDMLDLLNSISTRVGLMVRKVAREYYEADASVYKEKEIRDRDNMRMTTNESLKIDAATNSVIQGHIRGGVDYQVLKNSNSTQYKELFDDIIQQDHAKVTIITKGIVTDCIRKGGYTTVSEISGNIIVSGAKNRKPSYAKELQYLEEKHKIKNKKEFERAFVRYLSLKLYREMM